MTSRATVIGLGAIAMYESVAELLQNLNPMLSYLI